MRRVLYAIAVLLCVGSTVTISNAQAQGSVGVLLLHGKNPGGPQNPGLQSVRTKLEHEGMRVRVPDMPWSVNRYVDGDWTKAMDEIAGHLAALKQAGATKLVIAGHSIGAAGALSYAATRGGVDALVLLAPGHVPYYYYNAASQGPNVAVRASIEEARAMVAAGQGDTRKDFKDNNQGQALSVRLTAKQYLSYWDPESDAEMSNVAPKLAPTIPVFVLLGDKDPLIRVARSYLYEKLPANPKNAYREIAGTHVSVLQDSREEVAAWIKQALSP